MEKYAHATIGAVGYLGVAAPMYEHVGRALTPNELIFGMVVSAGAACLPDFDTEASAASTCLGRLTQAIHNALKPIVGGHRKGTHTVFGVALAVILAQLASTAGAISVYLPLLVAFFPLAIFFRLCFGKLGPWPMTAAMAAGTSVWMLTNTVDTGWLPFAFAAGYLLHILADMLTVQGVQPLYPLVKVDVKLPLFRSGGAAEKPLTWLVAGFGAFILTTGTVGPQLADLQARERGQTPPQLTAAAGSPMTTPETARTAGRSDTTARLSGAHETLPVASARSGTRETLLGADWGLTLPIPRCRVAAAAGQLAVAHPALGCGRRVVVCDEGTCREGRIVARVSQGMAAIKGRPPSGPLTVLCRGCREADIAA